MERSVEILSPVGDLNTFYVALNAGADAVYLGLPKFNARIKAENISLDNLSDVVKYAHLRGVKVYLTLNTLVTTSEMTQVVSMVDRCVQAGVDAYIVQDLGIISVLKSLYPDIVLHGSTQMGIHNVRGARVAKELGLSRIVLSRECTIDDILAIKQAVDIEIEVFVQGAMCVAFSGNCYMSALKCGASGNRGECKQLCRLPYTLTSGSSSMNGYTISMRDNSMMGILSSLLDIGVDSLKIEGRLRRPGYVYQMTSAYRHAVDDICHGKSIDVGVVENGMKRVFSRGEYIPSYNAGNDVIEPTINNHIGERIGTVVRCNKFKDIYQIHVDATRDIHVGDGIKFVNGKNVVDSIGVGNIDKYGRETILYGTKSIPSGTDVYLAIDSDVESKMIENGRKHSINVHVYARPESPLRIDIDGAVAISREYDMCEKAIKSAIDYTSVSTAMTRANKGTFDINLDVDAVGVFLPVSRLNAICRETVSAVSDEILSRYPIPARTGALPETKEIGSDYANIAIVCDAKNIRGLKKDYDALIYSPYVYTLSNVENFYNDYIKIFKSPMYLNLPMISRYDDMPIVDGIVEWCKGKKVVLVAENIYGLDYIRDGHTVMAGSNLNISNDYTATKLLSMGVREMVSSIEKWCPTISGTYKVVDGRLVLMTFAHCPNKTLHHNDCSHCTHCGDLKLSDSREKYCLRRVKIANCYFELVDGVESKSKYHHQIHDLRGGGYV